MQSRGERSNAESIFLEDDAYALPFVTFAAVAADVCDQSALASAGSSLAVDRQAGAEVGAGGCPRPPLGLAATELKGDVSIVNVFASWCLPCHEEPPPRVALRAENNVATHGISYKDQAEAASRWLDSLGDPYTRTGADIDGQVGIDWAYTACRRVL